MKVTRPKNAMKTISAVQFTAMSRSPVEFRSLSFGAEVNQCRKPGADQDPKKLVPVEEGDTGPHRLDRIVERDPQQTDEREQQKPIPPGASHRIPPSFLS